MAASAAAAAHKAAPPLTDRPRNVVLLVKVLLELPAARRPPTRRPASKLLWPPPTRRPRTTELRRLWSTRRPSRQSRPPCVARLDPPAGPSTLLLFFALCELVCVAFASSRTTPSSVLPQPSSSLHPSVACPGCRDSASQQRVLPAQGPPRSTSAAHPRRFSTGGGGAPARSRAHRVSHLVYKSPFASPAASTSFLGRAVSLLGCRQAATLLQPPPQRLLSPRTSSTAHASIPTARHTAYSLIRWRRIVLGFEHRVLPGWSASPSSRLDSFGSAVSRRRHCFRQHPHKAVARRTSLLMAVMTAPSAPLDKTPFEPPEAKAQSVALTDAMALDSDVDG